MRILRNGLFIFLSCFATSYSFQEPVPPFDSLYLYQNTQCFNATIVSEEPYAVVHVGYYYCITQGSSYCFRAPIKLVHISNPHAFDCQSGTAKAFPTNFDSTRILMADSIPITQGDSLWAQEYQAFWSGYGWVDVLGSYVINGVEYATPIQQNTKPSPLQAIAKSRSPLGLVVSNQSQQVQILRWVRLNGVVVSRISIQPGEVRLLPGFGDTDLLVP